MDEEQTYKVIVTKNGEQIPAQSAPSIVFGIYYPGDPVVDVIPLDVNETEFKKLRKQAVTNKIPADILRDRKASEA